MKVRTISTLAIFIALSVVGALLKSLHRLAVWH